MALGFRKGDRRDGRAEAEAGVSTEMSQPLTAEIVRLAYLLYFGRLPEDEGVVEYTLRHGTLRRLRATFLASEEFQSLLGRQPRLIGPEAPALAVGTRADDRAADAWLQRLCRAWAGVPPGAPGDAGAARDPDGALQARELLATLRRNGIDPTGWPRAFEFGCAGGRVARHLLGTVGRVAGCDLSAMRRAEATRAGLAEVAAISDLQLGMAAPFDLWFSHGALQVFPPALQARAVARALALLAPGGAAVFQAATYGRGYVFDPAAAPRADPGLERHVLPQAAVFALAADAGCEMLEVFEDLSVPPALLWRSSVFVLRKPARR